MVTTRGGGSTSSEEVFSPNKGRASSATSVGSSTTGSRPGLPLYLKKTLAKELQRRIGGPSKLFGPKALQKFLDSSENSPEHYGIAGDLLRRQISQKVTRWKRYSKDQWKSRVLHRYKISEDPGLSSSSDSSASSLENDQDDLPLPKSPPPIPKEISTGKKKTPSSSSKTPRAATKKGSAVAKKSPFKTPKVPKLVPDKKKPSPVPEEQVSHFKMPATKYHEIVVDTDRAFANGPFYVFNVQQTLEGVGKEAGRMFWGYIILLKVDLRWILSDLKKSFYHGRIFATDTVLISLPAWDFNLYKNRDAFLPANGEPDNLVQALDDSQDRFKKEKDEKFFAHYRLKFDGEAINSSNIFEEATEDEKLKSNIVKIKSKDHTGKEIEEYYCRFVVCRSDLQSRKKGKIEDEKAALSAAAQQLKDLGLDISKADGDALLVHGGDDDDNDNGNNEDEDDDDDYFDYDNDAPMLPARDPTPAPLGNMGIFSSLGRAVASGVGLGQSTNNGNNDSLNQSLDDLVEVAADVKALMSLQKKRNLDDIDDLSGGGDRVAEDDGDGDRVAEDDGDAVGGDY
ncbi:unknown protein [Seminavis robusta]|uniref:Uncharacterized protein n=1 Tax=Seminavis robusta TaxID=568900 RepID=A0A9N8HV04_9STRA|nr:unknown protein [Seminavis robusta]|eukprot:Sro1449_g273650.1 n/a (568) ;mRNA; r:8632-10547